MTVSATSVFSYRTCIILRRVTWRQAEMHLLSSSRHLQPNTLQWSLWCSLSAAVSPLIKRPHASAACPCRRSRLPACPGQGRSDSPARGATPAPPPGQKQLGPAGTECITNPVASGQNHKLHSEHFSFIDIYIAEFMQKSFLSAPCAYFQHLWKSFSPSVRVWELNCSTNVHTEMQSTKKWEVILTH